MKHLIVLFGLMISITAAAAELAGALDLSRLDQKANAGRYHVRLNVHVLDETEVVVTQKIVAGPVARCKTEVSVDAGTVTLVLTDSQKPGNIHQVVQALKFQAVDYSLDENCPAEDFVTSPFMHYDSFIQLNDPVLLKYDAPAGYEGLIAKFSVFPYGYDVKLTAARNADGRFMILDLDQQLSNQLNRGYTDGLQYEVRARKKADLVLLGSGFIILK